MWPWLTLNGINLPLKNILASNQPKSASTLADIVKKLRSAGPEPLEMSYDDSTRKLSMVIKGKWRTTFTLPTLDPGDEEVPTPKIAFNTKIKMISSSFKDIIDQIQTVSDNVRFETSQEKFIAEAVTELSGVKIELEKGSDVLLELEVKGTLQGNLQPELSFGDLESRLHGSGTRHS